jgi:hypothetical protein
MSFLQNRVILNLYKPEWNSADQAERNLMRNFRYETCGQADNISPVGA